MLTSDEQLYLEKIPLNKVAHIRDYDPNVATTVSTLRTLIKDSQVTNELLWIGASALGIAGQNDIDLHILSTREEWDKLSAKVDAIFGERVPGISIYKWAFLMDGFDVELYLSDPTDKSMIKQIKVFNILKHDTALRKEYERIKKQYNGKPFKEYMRAKYEFYHRIA